jgi:hypothetical protein
VKKPKSEQVASADTDIDEADPDSDAGRASAIDLRKSAEPKASGLGQQLRDIFSR